MGTAPYTPGGLSNSKLKLATATANDVASGKTFFSGDKTIKTGTFIQHDIAYHWYETKAVSNADYFGSCGCFVIPGKSATKINWGGSASGNFISYTNQGQSFTINALKNCKVTVQSVYNKGSVNTQTLTMTAGQSKKIDVANNWTNEYGWGIVDAYSQN